MGCLHNLNVFDHSVTGYTANEDDHATGALIRGLNRVLGFDTRDNDRWAKFLANVLGASLQCSVGLTTRVVCELRT